MDSSHRFQQCVLLLLLSLLCSTCQASCPTSCICTTSRSHRSKVDCSGKGLIEIPKDISGEVSYLDLRKNHIKSITVGSISHLTNLSVLLLDDNHIEDIEAFSFKEFRNVKKLSLKRNRLRSISKDAFSGISGNAMCSKATISCFLDVSENQIEYVESNAFSWISNLSLNMGKTGCDTTFKSYAFYGAQNIPSILIHDIPKLHFAKYWVSEMDYLQRLLVQHSFIPSIMSYTFEGLRNVKEITFQNCTFINMSQYGFSGIKFTPDSLPSRLMVNLGSNTRTGYSSGRNIGSYDVEPVYPEKYKQKSHVGCGGALVFLTSDLSYLATDMLRDTNLQYLEITGSRLRHINESAFRGLDCLKNFYLSENTFVNGLAEKSFGSLKHVEEVLFDNNDVINIHNHAFKNTQGVGRLTFRLKANRHLTLDSYSLRGLMDIYSLQILGVNHNLNKLILHKDSFYGLVDINNITISNVNIPTTGDYTFHGMGKVNTLYMVETHLNSISSASFDTFPVQTPIKTLVIKGDTGLPCDCSTLKHASDFDSMFENHIVMCSNEDSPHIGEDRQVTVQLYNDKQCEHLSTSGGIRMSSLQYLYILCVLIFILSLRRCH